MLVKIQSEHKIKVFWLDNSKEFIIKAFEHFLKNHDIGKQTLTPYRPQ